MAAARYQSVATHIERDIATDSPTVRPSTADGYLQPEYDIPLTPEGEQDEPLSRQNTRASVVTETTLHVPQLAARTTGLQLPQDQRLSSSLCSRARDDERPQVPAFQDRLKYSFSPEVHHPRLEKSSSCSSESLLLRRDTSRVYGKKIQFRRLWRLVALEWLVTASLCACYGFVLSYFSSRGPIRTSQQMQLNAIFTALSFLLGVNLAASMRSYAKLLRWLLLSKRYLPLDIFDLILRCDSLLNVVKVGWKANRIDNRKVRWTIRMASFLWITANVALTLFVGMVGLAQGIDPATRWEQTGYGRAKITDYSALQTDDMSADLSRIQDWAKRAYGQSCFVDGTKECYSWKNGLSQFWLNAWNPDKLGLPAMNSSTRLFVNASCSEYNVVSGGDGSSLSVVVNMNGTHVDRSITDNEHSLPGIGGYVALARVCENCQSRTTDVRFFASAKSDAEARYFECNNTVSSVFKSTKKGLAVKGKEAGLDHQFPDSVARLLAGAIGWNGDVYNASENIWQSSTYRDFSSIAQEIRATYGTDNPLTAVDVADYISTFTTKTMDKIDYDWGGLGKYTYAQGWYPIDFSLQVHVQWRNMLLLLVGIPALQLVAAILVVTIANRAIIKDDSPLSIAKLYMGLLQKHGFSERGCLLRGDEIVDIITDESKKTEPLKVRYWWKGYRQPDGTSLGHLDVFEEGDEAEANHARRSSDSSSIRSDNLAKDAKSFWCIRYDGPDRMASAEESMRLLRTDQPSSEDLDTLV